MAAKVQPNSKENINYNLAMDDDGNLVLDQYGKRTYEEVTDNGRLSCPKDVCPQGPLEWSDTKFEKGDDVIVKVFHAAGTYNSEFFGPEVILTLENAAVDMMAQATAAIVIAFLSVSLF